MSRDCRRFYGKHPIRGSAQKILLFRTKLIVLRHNLDASQHCRSWLYYEIGLVANKCRTHSPLSSLFCLYCSFLVTFFDCWSMQKCGQRDGWVCGWQEDLSHSPPMCCSVCGIRYNHGGSCRYRKENQAIEYTACHHHPSPSVACRRYRCFLQNASGCTASLCSLTYAAEGFKSPNETRP